MEKFDKTIKKRRKAEAELKLAEDALNTSKSEYERERQYLYKQRKKDKLK